MGAFSLDNAALMEPRQARAEELHTFHAPAYVEAVAAISRGERLDEAALFNFAVGGMGDNPVYAGMYEAALWTTGASLKAAEELLERTLLDGRQLLRRAAPRDARQRLGLLHL